MMDALPVSDIKVGDRYRKDLGDLGPLAESIRAIGLLNPVTVTPDGTLIAGHRRLAACQSIGMDEVPVHVVDRLSDALSQLLAERDENTCRLEMKPSELVALGIELEKLEKPRAQERMRATQAKPGEGRVGSVTVTEPKGQTRDKVGEALGWSGITYKRAKRVVTAAGDETQPAPVREAAQAAVEQMDRTGKVTPAHNQLAKTINPTIKPAHPPTNGRAPHQRKNADLLTALHTLSGYSDAITAIPLSAVSTADIPEAIRQLTSVIQELGRFRTGLKGVPDGT